MSTLQKILFLIIVFALLIIFLAIRNFVIHPYYNKSNITYAENSLTQNRQKYKTLINYMESLVKEDSIFLFENVKEGVIFSVLDSNKAKSQDHDTFNKKKHYVTPSEIVQIFKELKIDYLSVNYTGEFHCIKIHTDLINYSMSGKNVDLYYFPDKYKFGFFNKDNNESMMLAAWKNEGNKVWLYQIDSNWVIKSEK
ncbi:hypothetical protein [Ferruginibacter albus]|uniref:hypothetical protein n=1 Tax=Ferruginibacter albus TaxID=2875540 RepID=UPI001CC5A17E|nr:hypothetical protein [Ferruginibacter albus]UAY51883.1 hypothetical protein K9M53_14985 [Ferruginibacter albus]